MFAPLFGFIGGVFCVFMAAHMAIDWHFNGMAGVFAVLAVAFLVIAVESLE